MNKIFTLGTLCMSFFLFHCSNDCPNKQWAKTFIQKPGTPFNGAVSTVLEDQSLVLVSPQSEGEQSLILTTKDMVQGDFKATLSYQDLSLTAPGMELAFFLVPDSTPDNTFYGAVFHSGLEIPPTSRITLAGTGTVEDGGAITTMNGSSQALTNKSSGQISIERTGTQITVTITPDGETPTIYTQSMVSPNPTHLGFQFGSSVGAPLSTVSSVRITNFTVSGGGGTVENDSFTCNSIE